MQIEQENILNAYQKWQTMAMQDVSLYVPLATSDFDKPRWLHRITSVLNRIIAGHNERIMFHVPPQHGKSITLMHAIALYLKNNPKKIVAYVSYQQTFAQSQTRIAVKFMRKLGLKVEIDRQDQIMLVEGGGLITSSIDGGLTGYKIDWLIIDDPIKSRAEANSKVYRERVWDWWNDVAYTRIRPTTSLTIVHTRWHLDDLIGRLIKFEYGFGYIRIPALTDGLNDYGMPIIDNTDAMDVPLYYPLDFYLERRKRNPHSFSAMYQGLPVNKTDAVFRDATFYSQLPNIVRYSIGADLAYTVKTKSDYSVAVVLAESDGFIYVVDVYRWKTDIDVTKQKLKMIQVRYNNTVISLEANGPQKGIADTIKKYGVKIKEVFPSTDKLARCQDFSSAWNTGKVLLPESASWLEDYMDELHNFVGVSDAHDDQVDASVYAFNQLNKSRGVVFGW